MRSLSTKIPAILWAAFLGFLILAAGQGIWGALLVSNIRSTPAIPWSVFPMAIVLWLFWQYLGGRWFPRSTSNARKLCLRSNPVPSSVMAWALLAGVLAIVALAAYWIVLLQLVRTAPNPLADFSKYPPLTAALAILMASLVSPITEEAGFRGYCQVILEREFAAPIAILISSILFALAHLTQGFFWTKLLVYFLVGIVFGVTAYLTQSTLPALPVHIIGDLAFFILVWPRDSGRRLVWEGGADRWFWVHMVQAVLFTGLSVAAFLRLRRVAQGCSRTTAKQIASA